MYSAFVQLKTGQPGLFPHLINPDTGDAVGGKYISYLILHFQYTYITFHSHNSIYLYIIDYVSWGGMADSFYEVMQNYLFIYFFKKNIIGCII